MSIEHAIAQLRHAYSHLAADRVEHQRMFADGLIAPVIEQLERMPPPARETLEEATHRVYTAACVAALRGARGDIDAYKESAFFKATCAIEAAWPEAIRSLQTDTEKN